MAISLGVAGRRVEGWPGISRFVLVARNAGDAGGDQRNRSAKIYAASFFAKRWVGVADGCSPDRSPPLKTLMTASGL